MSTSKKEPTKDKELKVVVEPTIEETSEVVKPKKKKNYLNNKDMMAELRKCHEQDRMTEEFAKMIMLLAERYGGRYEYSDYNGHIEDMKAVAVINVVRAWRGFDLEKYNNPFAYFTQAIKHTFWQYVSQEKKHRLNRDAVLISLGELPSDAYMEDYEKEMDALREELESPDMKHLDDIDDLDLT
jgi:DNA-directed RNA polymerase specialized sigma subunit